MDEQNLIKTLHSCTIQAGNVHEGGKYQSEMFQGRFSNGGWVYPIVILFI